MILAAGLGTRLAPLTDQLPKPMVPVLGVPNIVRIIQRLKAADIREVVINTHWLGDTLETFLGNGDKFDVDIAYSRENVLLGTGGGIKKALPLLGEYPFLVVNGDALFAPDFKATAAFHRAHSALATLVVRRDPAAETYGAVGLDESGRVRRLVWAGDPEGAVESFMFTGMHVLNPAIGDLLPDEGCIVRKTYIPLLEANEPLFGLPVDGYFCDLGTPERYLQANVRLARGLDRVADISSPPGGVYIGSDAHIADTARLSPGTVIGADAIVGDGLSLKNAVVLDGAEVASDVRNAVVLSDGTVVEVGEVGELD